MKHHLLQMRVEVGYCFNIQSCIFSEDTDEYFLTLTIGDDTPILNLCHIDGDNDGNPGGVFEATYVIPRSLFSGFVCIG